MKEQNGKVRRTTPPACPSCHERKWFSFFVATVRCELCSGTGVVPAALAEVFKTAPPCIQCAAIRRYATSWERN